MKPKISIIVPVYNTAKMLEKCLSSIKEQTFTDFEVVIINDGSTDNSEDICLIYTKKDPRFKYYKQENMGHPAAFNFAYANTAGEFVVLIDSDDYVHPDLLTITHQVAERTSVDIVNHSYYYIKDGVHQKKSAPFPKNKIISSGEFRNLLKEKSLKKNTLLWFTTMNLIRKELLIKHNILHYEELKTGDDSIFNLECYLNANSIYAIDDPLYYYVYNSNSLTQRKHKSKLLEKLMVQFILRKTIYEKHHLNDIAYKRDLASYYLEHSLFYLISNEKNSALGLQIKQVKKIRNSEMYRYCCKYYKNSKSLILKKRITVFLFKNNHLMILCLIHKIFGKKHYDKFT